MVQTLCYWKPLVSSNWEDGGVSKLGIEGTTAVDVVIIFTDRFLIK
jgi:hypothetical protein